MLPSQIGDQVRSFLRKVLPAPQSLANDARERHETVTLVKIQASRANTNTVYIGDRQQQHFELTAGEKEDFPVTRLNLLFFRGTAPDTIRVIVISSTGETTPPVGP